MNDTEDRKRQAARSIREAINSENEAIIEYEGIGDSFPELKGMLQDIAEEEKEHIGELTEILSYLDPSSDETMESGRDEVREGTIEKEGQVRTPGRPTQRPVQRTTQPRPVQRPAQRPVQRPTQRPAQRPAQRPVQRTTQPRPTQRPAQRPVQRPPQPTQRLPTPKQGPVDFSKIITDKHVDDFYNRVSHAETGSVKDPWIRTTASKTPGGSTAYGPVQMTRNLIKDRVERTPDIFREGNLTHAKNLVTQGDAFNEFGNNPRRPGYKPIYDYGGSGLMGDTPARRQGYEAVAKDIIRDMLIRNKGDARKTLTQWRGVPESSDPRYYKAYRDFDRA